MKKLIVLLLILLAANTAYANVHTFQPDPVELEDLPHGYYYTWGINWNLPAYEYIVSATLTYENIYDYIVESDLLSTHLLNSATVGVVQGIDWSGGGDYFSGQGGLLLGEWNDPAGGSPTGFDLVYDIPSTHFSWLSDGNFGFGIDPDCHYYNDGVTLQIHTTPEPTSLLLFGIGGLGLGFLKRKKSFSINEKKERG